MILRFAKYYPLPWTYCEFGSQSCITSEKNTLAYANELDEPGFYTEAAMQYAVKCANIMPQAEDALYFALRILTERKYSHFCANCEFLANNDMCHKCELNIVIKTCQDVLEELEEYSCHGAGSELATNYSLDSGA